MDFNASCWPAADCVDMDTSDIISEIAKDTEKKGCLEDAVHLYDLAKVQLYNIANKARKSWFIRTFSKKHAGRQEVIFFTIQSKKST